MVKNMQRNDLVKYLDDLLDLAAFSGDVSNNGLQIEGKPEVNKVMFAVDACQQTFDLAVAEQADMLFVHHGLSWGGGLKRWTGINARRFATLFNNGISLYAYASTLFDVNIDFDEMIDDYLYHAYGEDYLKVKEYFLGLDNIFEHKYLAGYGVRDTTNLYATPESHEQAKKMLGITQLNKDFAPFFEAHKNMPMRSQTVAFKLLRLYGEMWEKLSKPLILLALGANNEAKQAYYDFLDDFGKHEVEIERYYDQNMLGMALDKRFTSKAHEMNIAAR